MVCCLNPDCENPQNPDGSISCQDCRTKLVSLLRQRYQIIKRIGRGGFGCTYLAKDTDKLNEQCVVKQLAPQFQGNAALRKATELFEEEAKRLQQLGEHSQIPSLYAYFKEDNYLYLVQQFIEGQNLFEELRQQGVFNETKIRDLLRNLLPVLQVIHNKGVYHRDIKPENILLQSDGKLVLIDFGVAKKATATSVTNSETKIGTRGYAPVEQMEDGQAYPASDLYSLGVTCFYLLTQVLPSQLLNQQGYSWTSGWRRQLPHPVTDGLANILDKLLQQKYQDRYQSAEKVLKDLNKLALIREPIWKLLIPAVFASAGSSFLAIALLSFIGKNGISAGLWSLILGGLIFTQTRTIFENTYLFIITLITTIFILYLSQNLYIFNPFLVGIKGILVVALLVILAGLLAFIVMSISQIFNQFISNFFNS